MIDQEDIYDEPPQQWHECAACNGEGYTVHKVSVYEHGCGFPHDDSEERQCGKCDGAGGWLDDAKPDSEANYCPYRHFTDEEDAAWARVFENAAR